MMTKAAGYTSMKSGWVHMTAACSDLEAAMLTADGAADSLGSVVYHGWQGQWMQHTLVKVHDSS